MAIRDGKLIIQDVGEKYIKEVNEIISKSGDVLRLSVPDKKLIALALMLRDEGKNIKVISDDYTIQNTLKIINIPYSGIMTDGIKCVYNWKKVCEGSTKEFDENLLEDIIEYLKEANYINDKEYIEKAINNFMILKNLSIKEIKYKLISKGLDKNKIEDYMFENKEELEEYEIKSAENIFYKKTNSMEDEEIKQYLLKKGYKSENISIAMENFNE